MHRIFCASPAAPEIGARVLLSPEESHHIRDVLRSKSGDSAILVHTPTRIAFEVQLEIGPKEVGAIVRAVHHQVALRSRVKVVCAAVLKGSHNDLIVEKCTELGVERVFFWHAERSVVRIPPARIAERIRRLSAIGEAAARQSQQSSAPEISILENLDAVLTCVQSPPHQIYCCSLCPGASELRNLPAAENAAFIIGPEGDFSPEEEALLVSHKATRITLGPTVLRAETCAIAVAAAANAAWGWRSSE